MKKDIIFALLVFIVIQVIGFILGMTDGLFSPSINISKISFIEIIFPLLAILTIVKIKKVSLSEINVWFFLFWLILFLSIFKIFELISIYPVFLEQISTNTSIVVEERQSYVFGMLFGNYTFFFVEYVLSSLIGFLILKKILKK